VTVIVGLGSTRGSISREAGGVRVGEDIGKGVGEGEDRNQALWAEDTPNSPATRIPARAADREFTRRP